MKNIFSNKKLEPLYFTVVFFLIFFALGYKMGTPNMLNTLMNTAYSLLTDTVLYIMGISVLSGALGKLLEEFGVVGVLEKILRPLMKPFWNLPGVAALGGVLTFLSDNPAIITLAKDRNFSKYFKKYQLVSITNFGTSFGMGLIVIVFMAGRGYSGPALIGFAGAFIGSVISTRIAQKLILKAKPDFIEDAVLQKGAMDEDVKEEETATEEGLLLRILNSLLDGGKSGVDLGLAIIPGVLTISTFVMMFTFGPGENGYTGAAYEGIGLLPALAEKVGFVFEWLFGFTNTELVAFPMTAMGAVGAALGLVPTFQESGLIDGNAIAVFTAMGMCWSGYLSTDTAMLDSLGYRELTPKTILAHTIGGLCAGIVAHWLFVVVNLF
ncbi:MAG: nucleoside recognition domain-containing protein [Bacteroidales bacterium]|nr:nucleoside recognition domain-containing protein [Bacteroidales bacterium]